MGILEQKKEMTERDKVSIGHAVGSDARFQIQNFSL